MGKIKTEVENRWGQLVFLTHKKTSLLVLRDGPASELHCFTKNIQSEQRWRGFSLFLEKN